MCGRTVFRVIPKEEMWESQSYWKCFYGNTPVLIRKNQCEAKYIQTRTPQLVSQLAGIKLVSEWMYWATPSWLNWETSQSRTKRTTVPSPRCVGTMGTTIVNLNWLFEESWSQGQFNNKSIEEFDHGSAWTLAAWLKHASRTNPQGWVADGLVIRSNIPRAGG